MTTAIRFIAFQAVWFGSVLGAANNRFWIGPLLAGFWLILSAATSPSYLREIRLAAAAAFIGLVADSLLIAGDAFHPSGYLKSFFSPLWMIGLWINLATTLNYFFSWLKGKTLLAACLGAMGGPAAYYAGFQLGAAQIPFSLPYSLTMIAAVWAVAMPLLVTLSEKIR